MRELKTKKDCVEIFEGYNISEREATDLIIKAVGLLKEEEPIELSMLPNKAYLNSNLDIVFKEGTRFHKLSKALKKYITL